MEFLLDTDTVSYYLRREGDVARRVFAMRPSTVCTSAIVIQELELGIERKRSGRLRRGLDALYAFMPILAYDVRAAKCFGEIAASLRARGAPIGVEDAMIAAHALSLDLTLVTHNVKHYARVPGLRVEDWY